MFNRPLSLVSFLFLVLFLTFSSLPLSTTTAQDSAIGLLKQMIAIAADNGGIGRTEELNALKQQIAALPKPARGDKQKARLANDQGIAAYKAGQYEQAKDYFLSAYQADPADAEIAGNLALVYLNLGDSKKVVETLTAALALAPGRASSWVNLATYFALQGQQREAVACYALTFHFSQNQNKTREFLQKLATNNPDQPKVQQAAQQALQLSLIQGNSGTVATPPAQDSLDAPLPPPAPVSSAQPNIPTAPQASTAAPVTPSASPTQQPMAPGVQTNVPVVSQASTTPLAAPSTIPTQPEATPPNRSARTTPTAEPQLATPSTREGGRSQRSQAVGSPQGGIEAAEAKKKADAEKLLAERVKMEKDKLQKEAGVNIQKASQIGHKVAKDIGVKWQFSETKDPMTDARIMKSEASFEGEGQLIVDIEATCLVESKKLTITATAFDSPDSGKSVPFIQKDKEVNLLVRLNESKPKNITSKIDKYNNQLDQLGEDLVMSDCYDKMAALMEGNPVIAYTAALSLGVSATSTMLGKKGPSEEKDPRDLLVNALVPLDPSLVCIKEQPNNKWFEFSELRVQFPLVHGNVIARIAPYEPNLHKVLEACSDVTPQTQLPEPSPSEAEESSSEKEKSSPNSSLFDSLKIQGKPLVP